MGEFKKGDVILHIGGHRAFVVTAAPDTAMWYDLNYLEGRNVLHTIMSISTIDEFFIKVDFCNRVFDDECVYWKLKGIEKALSK